MESSKKSDGFSMVDLLVAVVILMVLVGASMTFINPPFQIKKARDTKRKAHLNEYRTGLEAYAAARDGQYPLHSGSAVLVHTVLCNDLTSSFQFLDSCPSDPQNNPPYQYFYQSDINGQQFVLYANLETGRYWSICGSGKVDEVDSAADAVSYCGL